MAAARAVSGLCKENLSSMSASILLCLVQEPFETDDLKVASTSAVVCARVSPATLRPPGLEERAGRDEGGAVHCAGPAQHLRARRRHTQQDRHGT